jgi:acyl carrier protein|tara:strand:+ start:1154 stop:1378 length:225 start_codon:yes stop_codon:yes gene_type:complete
MKTNNEDKFLKIIKKNLSIKEKITLQAKVSSFKKWDSLNNVRILIDLNKAFKTEVKFSSINGVKDLEDLFNYFT